MDKKPSLLLCVLILLSGCVHASSIKTDVTVHFVPVGLGDSIFIDTPGKDVLIDGGDCGAGDTVVSYLKAINVSRIDLVVASHHDADHVCGLIPVLELFNVTRVWDKGSQGGNQTKTFLRYFEQASSKELEVVGRGEHLELSPGVELDVLSPSNPCEVFQKTRTVSC